MMKTPIIRPTIKQDQAWKILQDKETNTLFFGGGKAGGKSWFGSEWLMTNTYFYPGTKWFIARKELKRLMQTTYLTFLKVLKYHEIPAGDFELHSKYNYIVNNKTGSRIDLIDASFMPSDPMFERFGSLEFTGGWSEEAPELTFQAYEYLNASCGRHMNKEYNLLPPKHLLTGNPSKGWPYKMFYKPWKEKTLPTEYRFVQALYKDNPHTAEIQEKQLGLMRDKAQRERLMLGNWEYDDTPGILMDYDAIMDIFTNPKEENGEKFIIADIARFGSDRITISVWVGHTVKKIIVKRKQGTDVTEDDIRDLADEEGIPRSHIMIDEDGIGGGVVDHLKGVKGFVANRSPIQDVEDVDDDGKVKRPNYRNVKAQCAYMLADAVNNRQIAVESLPEGLQMELAEELEQIRAKEVDTDSPLDIVPKEQVKESLGRSPDLGDLFIMRMAFDLKKPKEKHVNTQVTPDWVAKRWAPNR